SQPVDSEHEARAGVRHSDAASIPAVPLAVSDTISDAARKRLEARITELSLDRDAVKKYVKDTFGKDHFKDMTKDEYDKLDAIIERRAARDEQPASEDV